MVPAAAATRGLLLLAACATLYSLYELEERAHRSAAGQERFGLRRGRPGGGGGDGDGDGAAARARSHGLENGLQDALGSAWRRHGRRRRRDELLSWGDTASDGDVPGVPGATLFAPPPDIRGQCIFYTNTDMWGIAVADGFRFKTDTAEECCSACVATQSDGRGPDTPACNVWVWCGDEHRCKEQFRQCWLKWLAYAPVAVPRDASLNESVGWTSGSSTDLDLTEEVHGWKLNNARRDAMQKDKAAHRAMQEGMNPLELTDTSLAKLKEGVTSPQLYHTVTTVSGVYNQWQTRIHYYHWLKAKAHCKRAWTLCEMGGFTRLLHSGSPDNIMHEIPTVVVDPMPSSMLKHDDYVVLNRPYALLQWVQSAQIPEKYVLMSEPDHIWLRPLPNFMTGDRPAAFNFGYMNPANADDCEIIKRLAHIDYTPQCESVAPIGNSPTFLALDDMKRVFPIFLNMSIDVYQDGPAKKLWGWCQEMFAFAMSMYAAGLSDVDLYAHMVAQPPFDSDLELKPGRPFYILHYTYGLDFDTSTGKALLSKVGDWHFDKRAYDPTPIPRGMAEPPDTVDFHLARVMVRAFNEATAAIPCWDEYHKSRGAVVTRGCGEKMYEFHTVDNSW